MNIENSTELNFIRSERSYSCVTGAILFAALLLFFGSFFTALGTAQADANPCGSAGVFTAPATCTYGVTGLEDTFSVPVGIAQIHVVAIGGKGGSGGGPTGGAGGQAAQTQADIFVSPSSTLYVNVGGNGADGSPGSAGPGGFNG